MADTHETFCDGNHTDRQACNRALGPTESGAKPSARTPVVGIGSADVATVIEAPPIVEHTDMFDGASEVRGAADSQNESAVAVPQAARSEMPAPSPWAVRAWEDTAAAVGATASPAPPPHDPQLDDETSDGRGFGHVPVVVGLAGAVTLAVLIARRRRK